MFADVPLSTFLTFNKLKKLAKSVEDIEKAISSSELLKLSSDHSRVCRTTELVTVPDRNVDECTIYVEALPTTATHDWVRKVFEAYGPVAYVSLPKFRISQQIKEFAFVEFEQRASVARALKAFGEFSGVLSMESDPQRLCSVTSYLKEQQEDCSDEVSKCESNDGPNGVEASGTIESERVGNESDSDGEPSTKRVKCNEGDDAADSKDDDANRKKVRRKKTTAKHHKELPAAEQHAAEMSLVALRITTKLEWKRLRNKYLNHQREQIKMMKKEMWAARKSSMIAAAAVAAPIVPSSSVSAAAAKQEEEVPQQNKRQQRQQRRHPKNINFYGAIKEDGAAVADEIDEDVGDAAVDAAVAPSSVTIGKQTAENRRPPLFVYESGIIVKVHFVAPCVDVKDFKADMRQLPFVKYVDLKEGDRAAFIRVDAPRSAPSLIKHCAPNKCQILTGTTEEQYWEKIGQDRQQKLSKALRIKPKRGREKINKLMSSHIRFDD